METHSVVDAADLDLDTNYVAEDYVGSTLTVAKEEIETDQFWNRGYTGAGVDVENITIRNNTSTRFPFGKTS